jgi:hypothetical protein
MKNTETQRHREKRGQTLLAERDVKFPLTPVSREGSDPVFLCVFVSLCFALSRQKPADAL